jgi:hypothetical protein
MEGDPKGWYTVLITALSSWEKLVPPSHLCICVIMLLCVSLGIRVITLFHFMHMRHLLFVFHLMQTRNHLFVFHIMDTCNHYFILF